MKQRFIIIVTILLIASMILWWRRTTYVPDLHTSQAESLIVGTSADFPPFAYMDNGVIVGFDIDVVNEVAQRLGKRTSIIDLPFVALIPELQMGALHIIAAGMTATEERAQQVLFTNPYINGVPLIVITLAKNPPVTGIAQLHGKEVIVNEGYTADTYMSSQEGVTLQRIPSVADAFLALEQGQAYAFVSAKNTIEPFFKDHDRSKFNFFALPGTQENNVLAISKKYPALLVEVQQALNAMEQDGTLEILKKKWNLV